MNLTRSRRLHAIDAGKAKSAQNTHARSFRAEAYTDEPEHSESSDWESESSDDESESSSSDTPVRPAKKRAKKAARSTRHHSLMLTHSHADHFGEPKDHAEFESIFVGASGGTSRPSRRLDENRESLYRWRQKRGSLSVRGRAIVPEPYKGGAKKKVDANATSLGEMIEVSKDAKDAKGERVPVVRYLSLGDMTPNEGKRPISEALGGKPVDYLKLPHHGSEHNIAAVPDDAIDEHTRVLVSGYTNTAMDKLGRRLSKSKPHSVHMLFHDEPKAREVTSTESFKSFHRVLTDRDIDVGIGRDYSVKVDDEGGVRGELIEPYEVDRPSKSGKRKRKSPSK